MLSRALGCEKTSLAKEIGEVCKRSHSRVPKKSTDRSLVISLGTRARETSVIMPSGDVTYLCEYVRWFPVG